MLRISRLDRFLDTPNNISNCDQGNKGNHHGPKGTSSKATNPSFLFRSAVGGQPCQAVGAQPSQHTPSPHNVYFQEQLAGLPSLEIDKP
jgi:hypothetical protein